MDWSAQVDEFDAKSSDVTVTVFVRQTISASESGFVHGQPSYATSTGLAIEKVELEANSSV